MKKLVITETDKKNIKSLYETKNLNDLSNIVPESSNPCFSIVQEYFEIQKALLSLNKETSRLVGLLINEQDESKRLTLIDEIIKKCIGGVNGEIKKMMNIVNRELD